MDDNTKLKIQVAYDAWQLTRLSPARLTKGSYLIADNVGSMQYLYDARLVRLENLPPCEVCALGALLVAHARRDPSSVATATRNNIVNLLPFSSEDLDTIETLFEKRWIGGSDLAPKEANELLDKFEGLRLLSDQSLARGLFHNLIENEGVLKLNAKLPSGGLWIEDTLKDTAKEVLEKYGILLAQEATDA